MSNVFAIMDYQDLSDAGRLLEGKSLAVIKHLANSKAEAEQFAKEHFHKTGQLFLINEISPYVVVLRFQEGGFTGQMLTGGKIKGLSDKSVIKNFKTLFPFLSEVEIKHVNDFALSAYWLGGKKC
ncbi:hypothetical protein GVX81_09045 [[Haemophilus] felis]|uniref:Uncharacterized protein n=1 Tax=[Haemophilus] felis TaxID=123822 RepID=A0A1T0AVT1_9PAST|nr:hypothetical protein [[Haemophilus] felis]OOS01134.1 hypothetical protein B0188_10125 [[Haemophilus] felis]